MIFSAFYDVLIVRKFIAFLQRSGEMGKTLAEMSIERSASHYHNVHYQAA
jgi:NADP-dependent alcohol dehydrogenase